MYHCGALDILVFLLDALKALETLNFPPPFLLLFSDFYLYATLDTMRLGDIAETVFKVAPSERERALERIRRSKPVEEDGFHFFSLPNDNEEGSGSYRMLKRPVALQFHYYGKLYKVTGERTAGVFELFLDLLYVAIIALFSSSVAESPDAIHIVKYVIIFLHAYQIWHDLREIFNSFYTDDILQRALILVVMGFMVVFANNAAKMGEEEGDEHSASYYTAVGAFQIVHFLLMVNWFFYSLFIPEHLMRMRAMGIGNIMSFCVRIGLFFTNWRGRIILAIVALGIERLGFFYIYSPYFKSHLESEFSTAVNIEHEKDRMTALYIIVLGEFLNSIILGAPASDGLTLKTLRALLILVVAFMLNWMYVHSDGSSRNTHPLRRSAVAAILWFWIHEPLCAVLVLSGDIAAEFTAESHLEHRGLIWIFCEGMAIGLLCLWGLSQCTLARDKLLIPKQVRMIPRIIDVIVFAILPVTKLDTTGILAVIAGLLTLTVIWETYGSLSCEDGVEVEAMEEADIEGEGEEAVEASVNSQAGPKPTESSALWNNERGYESVGSPAASK